MRIDIDHFYAGARQAPFGGTLTQTQVEGMAKILAEWDHRQLTDLRWLAYMLATTFHETSRAMVPVRELGGESYLRSKPYWPWVGEGLVQVTWEVNARKFGASKPGDCMTWPVALRALFDGMIDGMFARSIRGPHRLARYFNATVDDPVSARRIINGTDRAELVAGYHRQFLAALRWLPDQPPAPPVAPPAAPPPVASQSAPPKPAGWLASLLSNFKRS